MAATQNKPPATVPAKGAHMLIDLKRNSKYFEVDDLKMPPSFPPNTLNAQRLLTSVNKHQPDKERILALTLWNRTWLTSRDVSSNGKCILFTA